MTPYKSRVYRYLYATYLRLINYRKYSIMPHRDKKNSRNNTLIKVFISMNQEKKSSSENETIDIKLHYNNMVQTRILVVGNTVTK